MLILKFETLFKIGYVLSMVFMLISIAFCFNIKIIAISIVVFAFFEVVMSLYLYSLKKDLDELSTTAQSLLHMNEERK